MAKLNILLFTTLLFTSLSAKTIPVTLAWDGLKSDSYGTDTVQMLHFNNAVYGTNYGMLPTFLYTKKIITDEVDHLAYTAEIINPEIIKTEEDLGTIAGISHIGSDFKIEAHLVSSRDEKALEVQVLPIRRLADGTFEKLVKFEIELERKVKVETKSASSSQVFAPNSVLASGTWVKIAVQKTGMYKLTYDDLESMGLNPNHIRIFGNGGKMLDIKFPNRIHDDLVENSVWYEMGADAKFNTGDFLLFYAQGPNTWKYNATLQRYEHTQHKFDNKAYYFLTSDVGEGKQIETQPPVNEAQVYETSAFDDYRFIEPEEQNLLHSGAMWFSNKMYPNDEIKFTFNFPNILTNEKSTVELNAVARTTSTSSTYSLYQGSELLNAVTIPNSSLSTTSDYAHMANMSKEFTPSGEQVKIILKYTSTEVSGLGWYDYVRVCARRALRMVNQQMSFRDKKSIGIGNISKFNLTNAQSGLIVLDVSNWVNPIEMNTTLSGDTLTFKQSTDELNEFIAFYPNQNFEKPEVIGSVPNQNLHAVGQTDYLMIVPTKFRAQAERLAALHRANGLTVTVSELNEIYNEFSSGQRDITAIRWYAKSIYDKYQNGDKLKYLLLFGDGTYDNRINTTNNPNFIPTYQSENSLDQSDTYVSDDYFALMDNSEGTTGSTDRVDLGVGRFPVQTEQQASQMVDKIEHYMKRNSRKPWKNTVMFAADDGDNNIHASDANTMANKAMQKFPEMVVNKIYIHAYKRFTLASGPTYPDASRLIEKAIEQGCLLLNYSGHGGEVGLTDEKIVTMAGIKSYTNLNNLPLWVTATCEFSRYDLKDLTTAGEEVFLNPKGGGIGLFTTTRLVYSSANFVINYKFFDYVFELDEQGKQNRLGDVFRQTKKSTGTGSNKRKFSLLGDPGLRLAFPTYKVVTSELNGIPVNQNLDTLKALSNITVKGYIQNTNGQIDSEFNGTIYPRVYDKIASKSTIVDDVNKTALNFKAWETILYSGQEKVENGHFTFTFKVPKDIDYFDGNGRIVYYATADNQKEAHGYFEDFIIGGFNKTPEVDEDGPEISLFLNSPDFKNGERVNPNPLLIANLSDQNGINTTGASIGHDIVAILDNDPTTMVVLNDFYESGEDQTKGQLRYRLEGLKEGEHTLFIRVRDIYNNPSTKTISFRVENDVKPEIDGLYVYPNQKGEEADVVKFIFMHDNPDVMVDIQVEIFDAQGTRVAILNPPSSPSNGQTLAPVEWNLISGSGNRVPKGLYMYRVTMSDSNQTSIGATKKLLVR